MTAFLDITSAVRTALLTAPAVAGGRVTRGRDLAIGTANDSGVSINVRRSTGERLDLGGQLIQWQTDIAVGIYARATASQDAEAALDPLLASVWSRLAAMATPTGVVSVTLDPAIAWDLAEADLPVAAAQLLLRITHITTGAALAAA